MITQNTFERLSLEITEQAEEFILFALNQLRRIQELLIANPSASINERQALVRLQNEWRDFIDKAESWTDTQLAESYLRGIEKANSKGGVLVAGAFTSTLLMPDLPSQPISEIAKKILAKYPEHHTVYGVFRQAADNAFEATRFPIVRQQQDRIRQIITESSTQAYRDADVFTRRRLSQDLMRGFSDEGITGIIYRDGRRVQLDSYAEMVARSQTKNAFNQANFNRLQEVGIDLVVISVHYPCSDLCEPHQGGVFSISGQSAQYASLDSAIFDGLFHSNCKHSSSGWSEGDPTPDADISASVNEKMYKAQQKQRYNERNIKGWKRREATAVDPDARRKAKGKVSEWQSKQREFIKENEFLRRAYNRERI